MDLKCHLGDPFPQAFNGFEARIILFDTVRMAAPHGAAEMAPRLAVAHQDHVVNQHDRLDVQNGSLLAAISKSPNGHDAAHNVPEQEPIAPEHDGAVQKRFALRTHGAQVDRCCDDQPSQTGVFEDGNDVVKIIFLAAFEVFHAVAACNATSQVHSRQVDDFRLNLREIFSNRANTVIQGGAGVSCRDLGTGLELNCLNMEEDNCPL